MRRWRATGGVSNRRIVLELGIFDSDIFTRRSRSRARVRFVYLSSLDGNIFMKRCRSLARGRFVYLRSFHQGIFMVTNRLQIIVRLLLLLLVFVNHR